MTYIPGAAGTLLVKDADGSPSISNVTELRVTNGSLSNPDPGVAQIDTGAGANYDYFTRLAALLEPDALEPLQRGTFSYAINSSTTKHIIASYWTRLGGSGRWEVRDPRQPVPLRGVTVVGLDATSLMVVLDASLPTYTNAMQTYYERLETLHTMPTKYLAVTGDQEIYPLLPGAYGAIITSINNFDLTWLIAHFAGSTGWNLANELGDTGSTDYQRNFNPALIPINKGVINEIWSGQERTSGVGLGGVTYCLLPSSWSKVTDALAPYAFRDDFMGAALDTATVWTRAQSTAGNVEINTDFGWCKMRGNGNWGDNGMFSQASIARANGKVFLCDVYVGRAGTPNLVVGFHDGSGQSYSDFAHGVDFTTPAGNVLQIFENGNSRGTVGSGWSAGHTYRVRITLGGSNNAVYEIQGGTEYDALGGATWTDITPGTSSSSTTPLHAGATINSNVSDCYISDVRIY